MSVCRSPADIVMNNNRCSYDGTCVIFGFAGFLDPINVQALNVGKLQGTKDL